MAKIDRFEELKSWQKARLLADFVYHCTKQEDFAKDFSLRNQILSAAGSVMHNIAEGFDAGSNAEFIRFLKMARRSASEVQSELYLALDRKYLGPDQLNQGYALATDCKRLINGLINYLHQNVEKIARQHVRESSGIYFSTEFDDFEETT